MFEEGMKVDLFYQGEKQSLSGVVTQVTDKAVFVKPWFDNPVLDELGLATPIEHDLEGNATGEDNAGYSVKPQTKKGE